jgi:hypothetical protein
MPRSRSLLLLSFLLASCGTPNEGGGTELPNPIQVVIVPDEHTGSAAARQARIWSVDARTDTSLQLTARGVIPDSQGYLMLPPDSGTYIVESWTRRLPPDSLSLRVEVPLSAFPRGDSCLQLMARADTVQPLRGCGDTTRGPSGSGSGYRPEAVSWIRVSGSPLHPFRIVDTLGRPLALGGLQLWQITDSGYMFRGVLGTRSGFGLLPTLTEKARFVVANWSGSGPSRVQVRRTLPALDSANATWSSCADHLAALGSGATTLHGCDQTYLFPNDSLSLWAAVDFWPTP